MSRGKAKLFFGAALGLLVVATIAGLLAVKPVARRLAIQKAHEHGIELACDDLSVGFRRVTLLGCRFSLTGLESIHGTVSSLEVALDGMAPAAMRASGLDAEAAGAAPSLVLGLAEWSKRYPATYRLPVQGDGVRFLWRPTTSKPAWLELSRGSLERAGSATSFRAGSTRIGDCSSGQCADLGASGAAWTADDAVVMLGLGEQDVARSPVRLEVRHSLPRPTATISLAPVALERLADPFDVRLPLKNVTASATVRLEMPKGHEAGVVTGTLSATLKGYVPPHPRELDGFVFGDVTTLDTQLTVDEHRERVDLSETKVTAGAFKLNGSGSVSREENHARILLSLAGKLPCDALAGAAADSYLGKALGGLAGRVTRQLIGGSVAVKVEITARSDDLPNAKVVRTIGVGCGLKPLVVGGIDLSKLPLPIPSELPPLPSALPPLPKIELAPEAPKAPSEPKGGPASP